MAENSVITVARRTKFAKATSGAIKLPPITHIVLGTGGTNADGSVKFPQATQTQLNEEVFRGEIGSVTYPVPTTARYTATVPKSESIGVKFSEVGLLDAEGTLCVIKNMYDKQKDADVEFTFCLDDEF